MRGDTVGHHPHAAPATTPAAAADPAPTLPSDHSVGIDLNGRGWVVAPVAAAVAAALVWIHRRRRYRPHPPGPAARNDADLTPLPATVAALHRARPASTAEADMDKLAPEAQEAATVTTASLGHHANRLLHLPDLPTLGVGLVGPGASAAARGLLAAVVSAGGP